MTGRTTLSALLEMLADAAAMGAGKSEVMDKLQLRADNAQAFEAKAAPCLAAVEAAAAATDMESATPPAAVGTDVPAGTTQAAEPPTAADTTAATTNTDSSTAAADTGDAGPSAAQVPAQPAKISLAELESLVQEGQGIGVKLDSLTDLTRLLHTAQACSQQAEYCLTGKELHPGKHKRHHQRPSLEKVTTLVSELQQIPVLLPQAADLCTRQRQAFGWVDMAVRVLQQGNLGQHLSDVQAVVHQGTALGLEMPELTQLDALVRAIEWNSRVKQALRLQTAPPPAVPAPQQLPAAEQPPGMCGLEQQGGQGSVLEVPRADTTSSVGGPEGERGSPAPAGPSVQAPASGLVQTAGVVPWSERLTLSEAEALVEQGQELPVEPAVLQHLVELTESGQRWETQASLHTRSRS